MRTRIRVLLADDSALMRRELKRLIEGDPRLVVIGSARDGAEAVEQTRSLDPDVVALDINMPRMDGLEATKRIKEIRPSTKVVLISGNDRPPANSVADGFLAKPFRIDELCAAVQSILSDDKPRPRVA